MSSEMFLYAMPAPDVAVFSADVACQV